MNIPFVSFEKMHNEIKVEVLAKMQEIYEKNWFIQGPEVTAFEEEFAAFSLRLSVPLNYFSKYCSRVLTYSLVPVQFSRFFAALLGQLVYLTTT